VVLEAPVVDGDLLSWVGIPEPSFSDGTNFPCSTFFFHLNLKVSTKLSVL
jgi:hypothetical protein